MKTLSDKVAVVPGASRGLGKGIALGLGEAGATVYVTGRSTSDSPATLPGTVEQTAEEVTRLGGKGVAVRCDHRVDSDVDALFDRVRREEGRLDILINNAFASPEQRVLWSGKRFWEIPISLWDDLTQVGLRSHFIASRHAVPMMLAQGTGLIINVSLTRGHEGEVGGVEIDSSVFRRQGGAAQAHGRHGSRAPRQRNRSCFDLAARHQDGRRAR
jgi:dehydrogenase/reductase SDR family member 1